MEYELFISSVSCVTIVELVLQLLYAVRVLGIWKAVVDVACNLQHVVKDSTTRCRHQLTRTQMHRR